MIRLVLILLEVASQFPGYEGMVFLAWTLFAVVLLALKEMEHRS